MNDLEALRERLAGLKFSFVSVEPAPVGGPFPPRVVADMGIELTRAGDLSVRSTVNSGGGSYTLASAAAEKTTISFHGGCWEECALEGVEGDDANGTLAQRMEEAEDFLQTRFSAAAGPYELVLRDAGSRRELVLSSQKDGAVLTFVSA